MDDTSGHLIGDYIDHQLDREQKRRQSMEMRGTIVISGSVAAVAALFTILTYAQDKDKAVIGGTGRYLIYLALLFFTLAVVVALLMLVPRSQAVVNPADLEVYVQEDAFYRPREYSARQIAVADLEYLKDLVQSNDKFAGELSIGQLLQLAGLLATVAAFVALYQ